ncbi:hypothetical protein HDU87_004427 [Geranomyces variabilis]|uniref:Signal recognition particle receptor subunit beta n=1 Tax=Geranomyces variabilis TaxID=109894 RepID=A0AAD5TK09_9FUNG|nr:hypothetical protein HDU87_004427 [Geranomyces variabilis]
MSSEYARVATDALPEALRPDYLTPNAAIGIAFLAGALFLALAAWFLLKKKKGAKRDKVLLTGLSEAGKTVLFMQLRHGETVATHTSMESNESRFSLPTSYSTPTTPGPSVHLVDLPGHEKLRFKYTEHIATTGAIVFVLDSTTIARDLRAVAEYLYDILVNRYTQRNEVPLLVLCNKSELLMALPVEKIRVLLEGEIEKLRTSRAAEIQSLDDSGEQEELLGVEGEKFAFEQLANPVSFAKCSLIAPAGEAHPRGPREVMDFIENVL